MDLYSVILRACVWSSCMCLVASCGWAVEYFEFGSEADCLDPRWWSNSTWAIETIETGEHNYVDHDTTAYYPPSFAIQKNSRMDNRNQFGTGHPSLLYGISGSTSGWDARSHCNGLKFTARYGVPPEELPNSKIHSGAVNSKIMIAISAMMNGYGDQTNSMMYVMLNNALSPHTQGWFPHPDSPIPESFREDPTKFSYLWDGAKNTQMVFSRSAGIGRGLYISIYVVNLKVDDDFFLMVNSIVTLPPTELEFESFLPDDLFVLYRLGYGRPSLERLVHPLFEINNLEMDFMSLYELHQSQHTISSCASSDSEMDLLSWPGPQASPMPMKLMPAWHPLFLDVSYFTNGFEDSASLQDIGLLNTLNVRVRVSRPASMLRVGLKAVCTHHLSMLRWDIEIGSRYHYAHDPCGSAEFMGTVVWNANVKCVYDSSCKAPQSFKFSRGQWFHNINHCYGSMGFYQAHALCFEDGGRLPNIRDIVDDIRDCCDINNDICSSGRELIWLGDEMGRYTDEALKFADYRPYIFVNERDATPPELLLIYNADTGLALSELDDLQYSTSFLSDERSQLDLRISTQGCACVELFNYVESALDRIKVDTSEIIPFSGMNGFYVRLFDLEGVPNPEAPDLPETLNSVGQGFSHSTYINFYLGEGFSNPDFGVDFLGIVHHTYRVFFSTYIAHEIDECCFLDVECQGFCQLTIVGNSGSSEVCFTASSSYLLQIHYVRYDQQATDIALFWRCPSHLPDNYDIVFEDVVTIDSENDLMIPSRRSSGLVSRRIVPFNVLYASESEAEAAVVVEPSALTMGESGTKFSCCLPKEPEHPVTMTFSGRFTFNKCSVTFTKDDWNVPKNVFCSPNKDVEINGEVEEITVSCSSRDEEFDQVETKLTCAMGPRHYPRSFCHINSWGYVFNSWDDHVYEQDFMAGMSGPLDLLYLDTNFAVQGFAARCTRPGGSCLIGASLVFGADIVLVYKQHGDDNFSLHWKEPVARKQSDIVLEEWNGCWVLTTPDGCKISICPNCGFLEVNIEIHGMYTKRISNGLGQGLCFSKLIPGNESVELRPDNSRNSFILEGSSAGEGGCRKVCSIDPTELELTQKARESSVGSMLTTVSINDDCTNDDGYWFVPLDSDKLTRRFFGQISRTDLDVATLCEHWNKDLAGLNLVPAFGERSYKIFVYYYQQMRISLGLENNWLIIGAVEKNPLFCLLGKCAFIGCQECAFEGCNPQFPEYNEETTSCTSSFSVLVSPTGWVIKCFKGMCEYSPNGFTWEGLPRHVERTPYCLTGIDSSSRLSNHSVIWGLTAGGVKIYSDDFGKVWYKGDYTEEEKEQFSKVHVNPYVGGSVGIKGNDHSPPNETYTFNGVDTDRWWFTERELCVSSSRLASKRMIYCVQWWCECADLNEDDCNNSGEGTGSAWGC